jgi:hypothetical protein
MRWLGIMFLLLPGLAFAEIYHTGNCAPLTAYNPTNDLAASADLEHPVDLNYNPIANDLRNVKIDLNIPVQNYVNADKINVDLSRSDIAIGQINVNTKSAATSFNGRNINPTQYSTGCGNTIYNHR